MKKIFSISLILLGMALAVSCNKKSSDDDDVYGLDEVTNYYKEYTEKLDNAEDSNEVNKITEEAVKDYRKMCADNSDKFVSLLVNSAKGNLKPDDPKLKEVEEAWKECNLKLSEKTMGKYDYMPDFNDMFSLVYDKLPNELREPVKPVEAPYTFNPQVDDYEDECEDEHEHEHKEKSQNAK